LEQHESGSFLLIVFLQQAMDSRSRHAMSLRKLCQTLTSCPVREDGLGIKLQWLATDVPTFEPRAAHDQVALELRDCGGKLARTPEGVFSDAKESIQPPKLNLTPSSAEPGIR
jgi:hypothetical protein